MIGRSGGKGKSNTQETPLLGNRRGQRPSLGSAGKRERLPGKEGKWGKEHQAQNHPGVLHNGVGKKVQEKNLRIQTYQGISEGDWHRRCLETAVRNHECMSERLVKSVCLGDGRQKGKPKRGPVAQKRRDTSSQTSDASIFTRNN